MEPPSSERGRLFPHRGLPVRYRAAPMSERTTSAGYGPGVPTDPELPAVHEQLIVFARELGELYRLERARSAELERVLESLQDTYIATMKSLAPGHRGEGPDDARAPGPDAGVRARARPARSTRRSPTRRRSATGSSSTTSARSASPSTSCASAGPLSVDEWDGHAHPPGRRRPDRRADRVPGRRGRADPPSPRAVRRRPATPTGCAARRSRSRRAVFAVADSFDAMTSDRPYRGAMRRRARARRDRRRRRHPVRPRRSSACSSR